MPSKTGDNRLSPLMAPQEADWDRATEQSVVDWAAQRAWRTLSASDRRKILRGRGVRKELGRDLRKVRERFLATYEQCKALFGSER